MPERLLAALRERIAAYAEGGDASAILDEGATVEAEQLWARAQPSLDAAPAVEVVSILAYLYWYRFLARPEDEGDDDLDIAFEFFSYLYELDPELVPEPLRSPLAADDAPDRMARRAVVALQRAGSGTDPAGIDRAIELFTQAIAAGTDPEERWEWQADLCLALRIRFQRTGQLHDLDQAVDLGGTVRAEAPPGHRVLPATLTNLAAARLTRFEQTGSPTDLEEAVEVGRLAAAAIPADDPHQGWPLSNLCLALRIRYEQTGELTDLADAIAFGRAALDVAPGGHPIRGAMLGNLAMAHLSRFGRLGQRSDLDEAVRTGRAAVDAAGPDDPELIGYRSNLGHALRSLFDHTGARPHLDEAIRVHREAAAAVPADDPRRADCLSNLALALRRRAEQSGALDDLDEAVQVSRTAVAATTAGHSRRAIYLHTLSSVLQQRFDRLGDPADLHAAVRAARAAVDATPVGHAVRAQVLSNASLAALARFEHAGQRRTDIDEAIELGQAALSAATPDRPDRAMVLSNLGNAFQARFEHQDDPADLNEAVRIGWQAVDAAPAGHPERATCLVNVGIALETRAGSGTGVLADAAEAIEAWREAAVIPTAPAMVRMTAAVRWGRCAASAQRWPDALDGYATAIALLPLLAWRGLDRASMERSLADWVGLGADAAACALNVGQPARRAVELMEQGRGVIWAQALDTRTDLAAVRALAPELADELVAVRTRLESRESRIVDDRIGLARQWDGLVARVRTLPGLDSFPRPPSIEELYPAVDGPVIVVNASRWRCDAFVLDGTGIRVIELDELAYPDLVTRTTHFLEAVSGLAAADNPEQIITATLEWLWDTVAGPVLDTLGYTGPAAEPTWPRVWWCPTGPLTLLPLHAAGHHDDQASRTVLDRVVSSYTPTLRALARADRPATGPDTGRLLVVALPTTPGAAPLPQVTDERDLLTTLLPERCTVLQGDAATRDAVRAALSVCPWAHFSCHGRQDLQAPSRGGVLLHDGVLAVADLTIDQHDHGELAFLSACDTAIGGTVNRDEAISLVAALQYAGWRRVVGTLWAVSDAVAARITTQTYRQMSHAGTLTPARAAWSLHQAVRRLRDARPDQPSRWAPFIHAGL
jgi:tetratricopeptide (TPR) repeat protein